MTVSVGDTVSWKWGAGEASGTVVERFTDDVTRTLEGSEITRHASPDEPAFLIEQEDSDKVLKSITEIETS